MKRGFTIMEMMVVIATFTIAMVIIIGIVEQNSGDFKEGVRVVTSDGKAGIITETLPRQRVSVRVLMTGPGGLEQYQEVTFYKSELKLAEVKAEK